MNSNTSIKGAMEWKTFTLAWLNNKKSSVLGIVRSPFRDIMVGKIGKKYVSNVLRSLEKLCVLRHKTLKVG